ncbi:hypothetical protein [Bradyrhizobium septentrionale]|uniref:HEPN domain-containing protein n=1 Tax=Bradyrhizobium septentrionale TaxID=1404411 RepID=A0ABZ2NN56_9BRAD
MNTSPAIIEMPQPLGFYAGQLYDRGIKYLNAFEMLTRDVKRIQEFYHPSYFLCAHALELFLKAYLAASGVAKLQLRKPRQRIEGPSASNGVR